MFKKELDSETLKEELLCFISEEEYNTDLYFVDQFVKFIKEDLSGITE